MILIFFLFGRIFSLRKDVLLSPTIDENVITSFLAQNLTIKGNGFKLKSLEIRFDQPYKERLFYMGQIDGKPLLEKKGKLHYKPYYYEKPNSFFSQQNNEEEEYYVFKIISNFSDTDLISVSLKYEPDKTIKSSINNSNQTIIFNTQEDNENFSLNILNYFLILIILVPLLLDIFVFHYISPYFRKTKFDYLFFFALLIILLFSNNYSDRYISERKQELLLILYAALSFYFTSINENFIICIPFFFIFQNDLFILLILHLFLLHPKTVKSLFIFIWFILSNVFPQMSFSYILFYYLYYSTPLFILHKNMWKVQQNRQKKKSQIIFMENQRNLRKRRKSLLIIWILIVIIFNIFYTYLQKDYHNRIHYPDENIQITLHKWYPENNSRFFTDLSKEMIDELQKPNIIEDTCQLCCYKPINQSYSTSEDLIIIQGGGNPRKSFLSIKSLRTTGCKARIFLVIFENDKISEKDQEMLNQCGIKIFRYPDVKGFIISNFLRENNIMATMRFLLNEEFGYEAQKYIKRMFYYDTVDTVFQADPFNDIELNNTLYVSPENYSVSSSKIIRRWVNGLPNFKYTVIGNDEVICNGVYGSDVKTMIKLGQLMKAFHLYKDFISVDQAQFDYLIYINLLKRSGVNVSINKNWVSIAANTRYYDPTILGSIKHKNGFMPTVIHQYNRWKKLIETFPLACSDEYCKSHNL